ncbi:MAG: DUF1697 domain-containing protein [Rubrivivax sp.]|nr:DUF1697 domain-containing protein [Rubrivivax sp.]
MPTFVALLRGVNVGGARRVPMGEWRAQLEGLGYTAVATLLASGNAVFRAARGSGRQHAAAIAKALAEGLGIEVPVIVKSASELAAIVEGNPLAGEAPDPSRLLVAFAADAAGLATLAPVGELAVPPERFVLGTHAAYLHCPAGILASRAGEALLGRAGRGATTRNWATTLKLHALAGGQG